MKSEKYNIFSLFLTSKGKKAEKIQAKQRKFGLYSYVLNDHGPIFSFTHFIEVVVTSLCVVYL